MAARSDPGPSISPYSQSNHIDLTLDDDDNDDNSHYIAPRFAKRPRTDHIPFQALNSSFSSMTTTMSPYPSLQPPSPPHSNFKFAPMLNQSAYRPPFVRSAPHLTSPQVPHVTPSTATSFQLPHSQQTRFPLPHPPDRQVIDLTGSPSPPPPNITMRSLHSMLPPDLPPKTPVCIGELTVSALVVDSVPYLVSQHPGENEWVSVRLQYEYQAQKLKNKETIHIKSPHTRGPNGENISGENFGVVEQKVADSLGPMLGKGLIRLDAKICKGPPNIDILSLQMLVYTPKGNVPVVGNYLKQCNLFLGEPSLPYGMQRLANYHYFNPHTPPGGRDDIIMAFNPLTSPPARDNSRWTTPIINGKNIDIQRSQVDELFKSLKDEDELIETEPCSEVATQLYPHQKKAITFLLEREQERVSASGSSSLWQHRRNPLSRQTTWFHVVTQNEVYEVPKESKGAILADDMGLGKTITCVSLIAATLSSSMEFASSPLDKPPPPPPLLEAPDPSHFAGAVWGLPESNQSAKAKAKEEKLRERLETEYARSCRIKAKSRATLIICPLSTVSNWEDQFREHWRGEVFVIGGNGGPCTVPSVSSQTSNSSQTAMQVDEKPEVEKSKRTREGRSLRVYIYHGNARRPDPAFLADFDAVITTYATLASEYSKQNRSLMTADDDEEDGVSSEGMGGVDVDEHGNQVLRLPKPKKGGLKRKKSSIISGGNLVETPSALQSIHWFRVVLDEAHCIKETGTVASRACCDLMADRRLCLTGTPVQNKLDDVFALIKFLRLHPFDDKNVWTEFIGSPVKFGQPLGVARLQTIMKCITLRRTKETKTMDGKRILALPPRHDQLRYLKFDEQEQAIYDKFFNESKAEFNDLSNKNEVMKNYVGILQKILRLRQICDHFELVAGKELGQEGFSSDTMSSYEDIIASIATEGFNLARATAIFAILRESATTQCVECGCELCVSSDLSQVDGADIDGPAPLSNKRSRRTKGTTSRGSTRASSPNTPRPVLTRCQHLFCLECYRHSICPGWPNVSPDIRRSCSACQAGLSPADAIEVKSDSSPDLLQKKKVQKREKRQKGASLENFHPSTKVKALLGDLVQFSRTNPQSTNYDPEAHVLDEGGNQMDEGIVKTVVFSQWTSMLDKIEDALEAAGIRYDRLDGTMKRDDRTRAMEALRHDPGCEVLLVSLKAGGVGLNLTAAQRVYLMDPYWNPAVENQAVDRIHRLGQTRPVTTVKLIIENSIEARLLEVQRKKTALANMTLGHNFSKADLVQRRIEELNQLFGAPGQSISTGQPTLTGQPMSVGRIEELNQLFGTPEQPMSIP